MSTLKDNVDLHTQLAGNNRFEMLLFRLNNKQRYGINVFKVREVVHCMNLTLLPNRHPAVCGVAKIRELTVPVIDLSLAVKATSKVNAEQGFVIVTEYNNTIQGFLVLMVEKIVNLQWDKINPPPVGVRGGNNSYLTAVTNIDNEIIEILDVERVLQEISPVVMNIDNETQQQAQVVNKEKTVIVIDDSTVARKQITKVLEQLNIKVTVFKNGKEALNTMKDWLVNDNKMLDNIGLVICDIEMPEMDGYTFTSMVRQVPEFKNLYIILHTSLSGAFNESLVSQVGADKFISKFNPDMLAKTVLENIK